MSSQPQVAKLAPDLVKGVTSLARTLVAASRNWTLYPPDHQAAPRSSAWQRPSSAARLRHDRDLLRLTFSGRVPARAVSKLLHLLALDHAALRQKTMDEIGELL